ncbi:hypothetical protein [Qipengyuania aquimaris]|uniref:Uncharacterized protein n=1 Tax=Qipengyuania aquimaris TaxID=255984 RepID=A0A9Q3RZJ8_9SPHN|nr:hypothetical protein [Qipengyuania aquimaris]MBY6217348.1 hypothetical protein [Qipengyuania aquimaris]
MKHGRIGSSLVFLAATGMVVTPAMANSARDLRYIEGQNYGTAYNQLRDRGFSHIEDHSDNDGRTHTYWWNEDRKDCVHVEVRRGNVSDVSDAKNSDCNKGGGGGDAAAAVGVIAGVALLGALLSKKHHKKGKEYDDRGTAEFERGYRDGLHHTQYHNYNRTDAYSEGYEAGSEQRSANLRHHKGYAGYRQTVQFKDLDGDRARSADSALQSRGFRNVDGFKSNSAAYTIWYRSQSNQCLQMMVVNGRVDDIRDIRTHPQCR